MTNTLIDLGIDWADAYGWVCPFCGGDIDHLHQQDEDTYTDDSYTCQQKTSDMCKTSYMMVRWSRTETDPSNGDALTLKRWIQIEVNEQYIVNLNQKPSADANGTE